jgi:hypothetical protein
MWRIRIFGARIRLLRHGYILHRDRHYKPKRVYCIHLWGGRISAMGLSLTEVEASVQWAKDRKQREEQLRRIWE